MKISLPRRLMMRAVSFYRNKISPKKPRPTCKYYPCCSEYAYRAYETHGFFAATLLSLWRILRCNPFSHGGIDYVPGTPERNERQVDLWADETRKKAVFPPRKSD